MAAIWSRSMRDLGCWRSASNMSVVSGCHLVVLGLSLRVSRSRLVPFENGRINLLDDRRTGAASRTAAFHHRHDGIARVLVRREGNKPGGMIHQRALRILYLGRAGLAGNLQPGHSGLDARAVGILHVGQHGFPQDFQVALLNPKIIPHHNREIVRLATRSRVQRFNTLHQARAEDFSAVGNGGSYYGHLERSHGHLALADAQVARVPIKPAGADMLQGGEDAADFLAGRQAGPFAKVEALAELHDIGDARYVEAIGDEISVAGSLYSATEVVCAGLGKVAEVFLADEYVTGVVYRGIGVQPGLQTSQPDERFENGARRVILLRGAVLLRLQIGDA